MPSKPHKNRCDKSLDGMNETSGAAGGCLVPEQYATADGKPMTKAMLSGAVPKAKAPTDSVDSADQLVPALRADGTGPTNAKDAEDQQAALPSMPAGPETSALVVEPPAKELIHAGGTQVIPPGLLAMAVARNLQHANGLTAPHIARHKQITKALLEQQFKR